MARPKKIKSEADVAVVMPLSKSVSFYTASVKVMGKNHIATGSSISDAISALAPQNCKGKGILTLEHNGVKKERILMPVIVSRLFNTRGLTKEIALKQISTLFQGL